MQILFVSLGCDKNLVDSEVMLGILQNEGFTFTDDETEADIIIVNTCCFIGDAKEESVNTILDMARQKEDGKCQLLIVTGCLSQRYQDEILTEIPEVDAILGTSAYINIAETIKQALTGTREINMGDINTSPENPSKRVVTTGGHYAFLKIAEGCNKNCTYCIIPAVRGSYRSFPMEKLLEEAALLAEGGVRELILVAQETTLYGRDLYNKKMLPELLRKLAEINGIHWIRLQYCYPEEITDELIQVIKEEPKVCHYLDIPIQHASNTILRKMNRHTTVDHIRGIISKLRQEIPDIALRTTLITGFPGESEEDFQELYEFVDEMEFDRLGVFTYSREEDTPAADMPEQVPEEIKEQRRNAIMELQQTIAFENADSMIGRELEVIIEGKIADENAYIGRTYRDAPNVDGLIFVESEEPLTTGLFIKVKVTEATEYDLIGEIVHEFT